MLIKSQQVSGNGGNLKGEKMEDRGAYLISQSICDLITAMGMQAENDHRKHRGESVAYTEEAFQKVILDHGIGSNDAIMFLHE